MKRDEYPSRDDLLMALMAIVEEVEMWGIPQVDTDGLYGEGSAIGFGRILINRCGMKNGGDR